MSLHFVFTLILWLSREKLLVELSSVDVEYMVVILMNCEAMWFHKMLIRFFGLNKWRTMFHGDNQSYLSILKNPMFHDMSNNIEIIYHFMKDSVKGGVVRLQYISIEVLVATILTRPLVKGNFAFYMDKMRVVE